MYARPDSSKSYLGNVYIGTLSPGDLKHVEKAVKETPVENETLEWDCQEYVLEILYKLEDDFVLDGEDEDYQAAREELSNKRGAWFKTIPSALLHKSCLPHPVKQPPMGIGFR